MSGEEGLRGKLAQVFFKDSELISVDDVHVNLKQKCIVTTEDKARLCIGNALRRMEQVVDWKTPLGLVIAIGSMFAVSDFKKAFNISAETWQAFFMLVGIGAVVWLVVAVAKMIQQWNTKKPDLETIIEGLKVTTSDQPAAPQTPAPK